MFLFGIPARLQQIYSLFSTVYTETTASKTSGWGGGTNSIISKGSFTGKLVYLEVSVNALNQTNDISAYIEVQRGGTVIWQKSTDDVLFGNSPWSSTAKPRSKEIQGKLKIPLPGIVFTAQTLVVNVELSGAPSVATGIESYAIAFTRE